MRSAPSNAELEFIAEEELVVVIPKFQAERLELLCGTFGPFTAQAPVQVPLWLAVQWRRQRKCRVQIPDWLSRDQLLQTKNAEKESAVSLLQNLPFHYIEISNLLLEHAAEDFEHVHEVRTLLEDIESLRQHKIRSGMLQMAEEQLNSPLSVLRVNKASALEINSIRDILTTTLSKFYSMYVTAREAFDHKDAYQEEMETLREAQSADDDSPSAGGINQESGARNALLRRTTGEPPQPVARPILSQNPSQDVPYDSEDDQSFGIGTQELEAS